MLFVNAQVDYALTLDQTLRFGYNMNRVADENLGVGGYDEEERAFATHNAVHNVRVQQFGPLGRRAFSGASSCFRGPMPTASRPPRPRPFACSTPSRAAARKSPAVSTREPFNARTDLDYVRGMHSFAHRLSWLDYGWFHSDDTSNYLGTYTFENLDAYL